MNEPKELNYPLTEAKADTVDGVRETPVDVVTEAKDGITNTVTVTEVKRLIREAIDHFEKEEGGVTEDELREALADYAKKVGALPYYEYPYPNSPTVQKFMDDNDLWEKPFVCKIYGGFYVCNFTKVEANKFNGEMERLSNSDRYEFTRNSTTSTFISYLSNPLIRADYALKSNSCQIHKHNEGEYLSEGIWSQFKTGDILIVDHMRFVVDVFETTGEGAYKAIVGKMISSITATSISVISIDWRTVGEGYTALTPVTTTFSVGGNE